MGHFGLKFSNNGLGKHREGEIVLWTIPFCKRPWQLLGEWKRFWIAKMRRLKNRYWDDFGGYEKGWL